MVICAVFRDEAEHFDEWLDFHRKAGVTKVVLYDDASTDQWRAVLEPWIEDGLVELRPLKVRDQLWAFNDCLRHYRWSYQWFAFIDIDEFIFPGSDRTLPDVLKKYTRWAGVFVFWELFGANGRETTVSSNLLRSNTACMPLPTTTAQRKADRTSYRRVKGDSLMTGRPFHGKTVAQGWRTWKMGNHVPIAKIGKVVDEQRRKIPRHVMSLPTSYLPSNRHIKLNHYWAKSQAHLARRANRRNLSGAAPADIERYQRWEKELNRKKNQSAVEYRSRRSQPFVFIIGFNKTGTRSLHRLFFDNGLPAIHWDDGRLALAMRDNRSMGVPILTGYDIKYRIFSDLTHVDEDGYCEANKWFRELDLDYPGSYFILNNRPIGHWLLSRTRHEGGKFLQQHMSLRGLTSPEETINQWASEREAFHSEVRSYFAGSDHFLEVDIEHEGVAESLSEFLNLPLNPQKWSRRGKTDGPRNGSL